MAHVVYVYRLRLHICTLELLASLSVIYALLSRAYSYSQDFSISFSADSYFQRQTETVYPNAVRSATHNSQAWESLLGLLVYGTHRGLTPQMNGMPVVPKKTSTFVLVL